MNIECLLDQLIMLFVILLIARVILSFFPIAPGTAMATIYGVLYNVTEPVLGPIRNVLPSMGPFDLSPMLVIFGANIIQSFLC